MNETVELYDWIQNRIKKDLSADLTTLVTENERTPIEQKIRKLLSTELSTVDNQKKLRLYNELLSAGPIENLLHDNEVTEIIINGPYDIAFEKYGLLHQHDEMFFSQQSFSAFLGRLFLECKIQPDLAHPFADGIWRGYRVHCTLPPVAKNFPLIVLRKQPTNVWTFDQLEKRNWAPPEVIETLRALIVAKENILILGGTGTGKTSVLNAGLQVVPPHERVITLEDTAEIHGLNKFSSQLLTRRDANQALPNIDLTELLKQSLRMRPDRLVMGEVRGGEAKDLLMAFSTGHRGGFSTIHADSPRQALYRLEMLVQMGAPQWSIQAIRNLILFGVDILVTVEKVNGQRRLKSLHRIATLEESGFCLHEIYA